MVAARYRPRARSASAALCLLGTLAGTPTALGAPVVINLGVSPGGAWSASGIVSGDGNVVTGVAPTTVGTGTPLRPFRWVYPIGPMTPITMAIGNLGGQGNAINHDGSVVVGGGNSMAFRWTQSGGVVYFAPLSGGSIATAWGVSADGNTLAGQSNSPQGNRAVRWNSVGVITNLGVLPGALSNASSVALGISPDGLTIVGASGTNVNGVGHAFRWVNGVMTDLGVLSTGLNSSACDVSADNGTIVGTGDINFNSNNERAMRWKPGFGWYNLGVLPGGLMSRANAVNSNGFAIVGRNYDLSVGWRAFIWTPANGIIALKDYVNAHGGNTTGWTFDNAEGISYDGTAVSGSGTFNGQTRAFLIRGLPCPNGPGWTQNPVHRTICEGPDDGTGGTFATLTNDAEVPDPLECTYSWFIESPPNSGVHVELTGPVYDDPLTGLTFEVAGLGGPSIEIGNLHVGQHPKDIRFIPWVTNPCGSAAAAITLHVQTPCNLADLTSIGGTADAPGCPDEQLTLDDVLVFIDLYNESAGCPAGPGTVGACNKADVTDIGDNGSGPDGLLTLDDILAFVNAYNEGC